VALAWVAAIRTLVGLAGGDDPDHDLPIGRWASEAGDMIRRQAVRAGRVGGER
jgi:hypothetical protein